MVKFIACIGYGFDGKILCNSFSKKYEVLINDIVEHIGENLHYFRCLYNLINYLEEIEEHPIYFICVPTPINNDGKCISTIVDTVINNILNKSYKEPTIIIKSTISPKTCERLSNKYKIPFCLVQEDKNNNILLGITPNFNINLVKEIYQNVYNNVAICQIQDMESAV